MGAHKHHFNVCLYTLHCQPINPCQPTKLSNLPPDTTHFHLPSTALPIRGPHPQQLHTKLPPNTLPYYLILSHTPPAMDTSKLHKRSIHHPRVIATHTPQHCTHRGKQTYMHLPPHECNHKTKHKIQKCPIFTLTFETTRSMLPPRSLLPPFQAPPHISTHKGQTPPRSLQSSDTAKPP